MRRLYLPRKLIFTEKLRFFPAADLKTKVPPILSSLYLLLIKESRFKEMVTDT